MPTLPKPNVAEPARIYSLGDLCPAFRVKVELILADINHERVFETIRTEERQIYLYGFGRLYDDGRAARGPVTNARTAMEGWHFFGLGTDVVEDDATPWVAPVQFWQDLGLSAERHGCVWGGRWKRADLPHVQMGGIPRSPTDHTREVFRAGGLQAVWDDLGLTS